LVTAATCFSFVHPDLGTCKCTPTEDLPMRRKSMITLATFGTGLLAGALLATPARSDVIMDWNAKAVFEFLSRR
jgi:hypothetical protein